jgi:uncharacterized protein (TIGR02466 family)
MASRVETFDLFATRIWIFDLDPLRANFPTWRSKIDRLRQDNPGAAGRSNRLGWNSEATLFTDPAFAALDAACKEACEFVFKQMNAMRPFRIHLDAWANVHDRGAYNRDHIHGGALLSGCFYLTVPPGSGPLVFNDPRIGATLSPFTGQQINSGHAVSVDPIEGRLILFPNWLSHGVEPHGAAQPRVSICMNAAWSATALP